MCIAPSEMLSIGYQKLQQKFLRAYMRVIICIIIYNKWY